MDYPKVTVIIPMRNEERFIGPCLESILANDYPMDRVEILVMDGRSTDRSAQIVLTYAKSHPNIRLLDNPDQIIPAALNLGIRNASGEIIIRADAHAQYAQDYIRQSYCWKRALVVWAAPLVHVAHPICLGLFPMLCRHGLVVVMQSTGIRTKKSGWTLSLLERGDGKHSSALVDSTLIGSSTRTMSLMCACAKWDTKSCCLQGFGANISSEIRFQSWLGSIFATGFGR